MSISKEFYLLSFIRTLIVSSLGQLAESVAGTGQVESGLAADMTHSPEDSEKVNEVHLLPGDLKHRLAHPIGFVSTLTGFASIIVNTQDCICGIKHYFYDCEKTVY